jgi:DNA uptake protein ComE-like DNA-binding protein
MRKRYRLPKNQRRGLLLLVFAVLLFAVWRVAPLLSGTQGDILLTPSEADSLSRFQGRLQAAKVKRGTETEAELFPFDPNHADSLTLRRLGLAAWQVGNMMKYRAKGGVWRSAEDLRRLYGLTERQYARLRPYVRIAPQDRPAPRAEYTHPYGTPRPEKPEYAKVEKYPEGTILPLNAADTTELQRIPGIGSYYARKICGYRERLGGFVSLSQLDEVEGLPAGVSRWFTLDGGGSVRRIQVNRADFKTLVRHPYLDYEQTKAICNHIRHYGKLRGWSDLRLYTCFTEKDFRRLAPYFVFD